MKLKNFLLKDHGVGGGQSAATAFTRATVLRRERTAANSGDWVTSGNRPRRDDCTSSSNSAATQHPVPTRLLPLAKRARGSGDIPRSWSPSPWPRWPRLRLTQLATPPLEGTRHNIINDNIVRCTIKSKTAKFLSVPKRVSIAANYLPQRRDGAATVNKRGCCAYALLLFTSETRFCANDFWPRVMSRKKTSRLQQQLCTSDALKICFQQLGWPRD